MQRAEVGPGEFEKAPRLKPQAALGTRAAPLGKADVPVMDAERSTVEEFAAQQLNRPHGMLGGAPTTHARVLL